MLRRTGPASGSKTIRSRVHDTLSTVKSGSPLEREHLVDGGTGQRLARLAPAAAEVWRQDQSAAPPARAARSPRSRGLRGCRWPCCPPRPTATGDGLLAATLDAIEDRLNVVRHARVGFGRARHRFARFTREDPVLLGILGAAAAALVGGVTWAAVAASRR